MNNSLPLAAFQPLGSRHLLQKPSCLVPQLSDGSFRRASVPIPAQVFSPYGLWAVPELELDHRIAVVEEKPLVDPTGREKSELPFQNSRRPVDEVRSSIVSNQDIGRSLQITVTQASLVNPLHEVAQGLKKPDGESFLLIESFDAAALDFLEDQCKASDNTVKRRNALQSLEPAVRFLLSPDQEATDEIPEHPAVGVEILDDRSRIALFDPVQSRPR